MSRLMLIFVLLNTLLVLFGIMLVFHDFELVASSMELPVNLFAGIFEKLTLKDVKYILIAMGVALLVVIVFGAIGLLKESRWYLITYGILMDLLAVANLGLGVYLLNQTDSIKKTVDTFMDDSFLDPSLTIFHQIESRFKCCGTYGPDFYLTYEGEDFVAPSCCEGGRYCSKVTAYKTGCSHVLRAGLEKESTNWGFILLILAVVQYANVMRVLAVAKLVPSFVLLVQTLELRQTVENYVNKVFDDPSTSKATHFLETLLKCCGATGPEAYINSDGIAKLPPTCCDVQDNETSCLIDDAYQQGCATLIGEAAETWSTYLGYLFIFIIGGEVVNLAVASYVISAIKQKLLRD